jgi:glycosyltransferase involved in cell wall biosynthesis
MTETTARITGHLQIPGTISLVLPAFNEEANIEIVVRDAIAVLPRYADNFEIIPVNDGSRDATGAIIDRLHSEEPRVRPVHHKANKGYGGAVASGISASTGDFVMFMDADRQFDIADIRRLAPFVAEFDCVAGFRMERADPLLRRVNAEIFNLAVRIAFGVHLRDLDCAFKIFRGDIIRAIPLTSSGALINAEMQAKLRRQRATLQQVGVPHHPRVAGTPTGGNLKVILKAMRGMVILWIQMLNYTPPNGQPKMKKRRAIGGTLLRTVTATGSEIWSVARRLMGDRSQ